jgi:hypothetical protein
MPSWSGLFDGVYLEPHSLTNQFTSTMRSVARLMASSGGQHFGEIGRALAAGGPGTTAVLSYMQVSARQSTGLDQGGKVPIQEYFVVPPRTTTTIDKEIFQAQMTPRFAPVLYPIEKSGTGGGGMGGTLGR